LDKVDRPTKWTPQKGEANQGSMGEGITIRVGGKEIKIKTKRR